MLRTLAGPLLVVTLGLAGCTTESSGCTGAAIDYSSATKGAASARAALTAYLEHAPMSLPKEGWRESAAGTDATKFESVRATVEVSRFRGGWNVTGYQTCGA